MPPSGARCSSFWGRLATTRPSGAGRANWPSSPHGSAALACPAACWAAWADALPVLHQRRPDVAARCVREQLFEEEAAGPALREAAAAARSLEAAGWEARPAWPRLICRAHLRLQSQATCREVGKGTLLPH